LLDFELLLFDFIDAWIVKLLFIIEYNYLIIARYFRYVKSMVQSSLSLHNYFMYLSHILALYEFNFDLIMGN